MSTVAESIKLVVFGTNLEKEILLPPSMRILEGGEDIPQDCRLVFRMLNQKDGDKRIVWDSNDWNEIVDAKDMFNRLIEEGMIPYRVDLTGRKSPVVMTEFDPLAEEVLLSEKEERAREEVVFTPGQALAGG